MEASGGIWEASGGIWRHLQASGGIWRRIWRHLRVEASTIPSHLSSQEGEVPKVGRLCDGRWQDGSERWKRGGARRDGSLSSQIKRTAHLLKLAIFWMAIGGRRSAAALAAGSGRVETVEADVVDLDGWVAVVAARRCGGSKGPLWCRGPRHSAKSHGQSQRASTLAGWALGALGTLVINVYTAGLCN